MAWARGWPAPNSIIKNTKKRTEIKREVMKASLFVDFRTPFLINNIFLIAPSSLYPISYRLSALPFTIYIARHKVTGMGYYHGLQNASWRAPPPTVSSRVFLRLLYHYDTMPLPGEDEIPEDGKHVEGQWGPGSSTPRLGSTGDQISQSWPFWAFCNTCHLSMANRGGETGDFESR